MKPIRSMLFVPGNKESMLDKAAKAGADALILDLEDSVPHEDKVFARTLVASRIKTLADQGQRVWVRINKHAHVYDFDDILAIVQEGLEGVMISKGVGPEDVHMANCMIAEAEIRNGIAADTIAVIPLLETARAMQLCYEMAKMPRVAALVGATAKDADMGRALGFVWTPEGRETDYLKLRVVMAARAAGIQPIGGLWQYIKDLEGQANMAKLDRQLGMAGSLVLHPAQVEVVNQAFSPTEAELAYYQGLIDALDAAVAQGRASVMHNGEHIDFAHVKTAREIIAQAKQYS